MLSVIGLGCWSPQPLYKPVSSGCFSVRVGFLVFPGNKPIISWSQSVLFLSQSAGVTLLPRGLLSSLRPPISPTLYQPPSQTFLNYGLVWIASYEIWIFQRRTLNNTNTSNLDDLNGSIHVWLTHRTRNLLYKWSRNIWKLREQFIFTTCCIPRM